MTVDAHMLGVVFVAETSFVSARDPDTIRAPDVAFVSADRVSDIGDESALVPFTPDMTIEVVSPGDPFSKLEEYPFSWMNAGTR